MPERINGGQALVAIGAIVLLVSLFLSWYEPGLTAWTVFEVWDLVLAAICVAALATLLPVRRTDLRDEHAVPERWLEARARAGGPCRGGARDRSRPADQSSACRTRIARGGGVARTRRGRVDERWR